MYRMGMYRMGLMSLIVGDVPGVDRDSYCSRHRAVRWRLEERKKQKRAATLEDMCKVLGGGTRAEEIQELWHEYENNSSKQANLVKDFLKIGGNDFASFGV